DQCLRKPSPEPRCSRPTHRRWWTRDHTWHKGRASRPWKPTARAGSPSYRRRGWCPTRAHYQAKYQHGPSTQDLSKRIVSSDCLPIGHSEEKFFVVLSLLLGRKGQCQSSSRIIGERASGRYEQSSENSKLET